ncbi:MAG: hypothetical protein ABSE81_07470 [Candidatus Omnitrophota bacterium]
MRSLATAAETYSTSHAGTYPSAVSGTPSLTDFIASAGNYCSNATGGTTAIQGYNYACTLTSGGYTFVATPVTLGTTGGVTYTSSTGGVITPL